jgi:hypothetical protein
MPLAVTSTGRQRRQMCLMNQYGFPRTKAKGKRRLLGFRRETSCGQLCQVGNEQEPIREKSLSKRAEVLRLPRWRAKFPMCLIGIAESSTRPMGIAISKERAASSRSPEGEESPPRKIVWLAN